VALPLLDDALDEALQMMMSVYVTWAFFCCWRRASRPGIAA